MAINPVGYLFLQDSGRVRKTPQRDRSEALTNIGPSNLIQAVRKVWFSNQGAWPLTRKRYGAERNDRSGNAGQSHIFFVLLFLAGALCHRKLRAFA
jgi:hypothetical protein